MIQEIVIPYSLRKTIKGLPYSMRGKLYWCIDMLMKDERHPSLRHKKIEGAVGYWEFSITMNYRGVYRREGDKAFLIALGKHEDVF
ncbi:MAG: hypothetical protein M1517_04610 [Deltaproteobacteria bacterium]|nr:hypothetical protein [Deltaproteobacteria bacterium]